MKKGLQKYGISILFIYLVVLHVLGSTWTNRSFSIPEMVQRLISVAVYIPFVLAVIWKVMTDLKEFPRFLRNKINLVYYLFAVYYVCVSVYRLVKGMEVKESLFYSVFFFGCVAIYLLSRDHKIRWTKQDAASNMLALSAALLVFRLLYVTVGAKFIPYQPININLISCMITIMLPFLLVHMCQKELPLRQVLLYSAVAFGNVVVILTTGSRAIFMLGSCILAALVICNVTNLKRFTRVFGVVLVGVLVVVLLGVYDVGTVRESIYRESGIRITAQVRKAPAEQHEEIKPVETATETPEAPPVQVQETPETQTAISDVEEQLGSSDRMRSHLMQYGITQVKLNPWFGTGDVKYYYQITEENGFLQSSHNFIIEALNCYGIFGLIFIVLLFTAIIFDTGLFKKQLARDWQYRIAMLMAVGVYLAIGFVQPVVFDCLVCLVFVSTVSACKKHMAAEAPLVE